MGHLDVPSNKEIEAQTLVERAEKKANSFSFFGGNSTKFEDASEMLASAGNLYKIEKKFKEAGDAYTKSSEYLTKAGDRDEAANKLVEASKCYRKSNPADAVKVLTAAVEMLKERGRFHPAAGHMKTVSEIYETDIMDVEKAMHSYEAAAELYSGEDAQGQANQCNLKVGTFAAQLEQYDKAIEKFEMVGTKSLENTLTKYSVKEYFFKAALCHICKDPESGQRAVERYQDLDVTFATTRECQLLKDILSAIEAGDQKIFTRHIAEYDRLTKLDEWKTTILLRIKKAIDEEPSLT